MGKIIFFSGPDGSGKTTSFLHVIQAIKQADMTAFQLRNLQVGRIKILNQSRAKKHVSRIQERADQMGSVGRLGYSDLPRDRGQGTRYVLRRYIGLLAAILDITSYGRIFLRSTLRKHDVVLVEECPFDVFAKRHRPFFPWTARLLAWLIPQPDLIVFCVADPDEIVGRKPELTKAEIENYYGVMKRVYGMRPRLPIYQHDTNPSQSPFEGLDAMILKIIE